MNAACSALQDLFSNQRRLAVFQNRTDIVTLNSSLAVATSRLLISLILFLSI